ncbi:dihydroxyacetone kinase subunit DhaK [Mycolicibacterium litorale]
MALVSGGGSGHEPIHSGLIGEAMLDAVCRVIPPMMSCCCRIDCSTS